MATNVFVEIDFQEARIYADLNGIRNDLMLAQEFARELKNVYEKYKKGDHSLGFSVIDALSTACLVRYWRCFASGKRRPLTNIEGDIINSLDAHLKAVHELFGLWRDKHIAHSVDECEQNQPNARYWLERLDEEGFTSISCNSTRLAGMTVEDANLMIELTETLFKRVNDRIRMEEKVLLDLVRSKPISEIMAAKDKNFITKPMRIGKPRKH